MPRWKQVWNEDLKKHEMIEVDSGGKMPRSHFIHDDFKPFVSPIDQTVVSGRRQYDDHCRKHNVMNAAELDEGHFKQRKKAKDDHYQGARSRQEIQKSREHIHQVMEQMERKNDRR